MVALLFSLKIMFKSRGVLIRGNHEARDVNQIYGFQDECRQRVPGLAPADTLAYVCRMAPFPTLTR